VGACKRKIYNAEPSGAWGDATKQFRTPAALAQRREQEGVPVFTARKYLRWAEEAEVYATRIEDIWAKELWRQIASAYRELAQKKLTQAANCVEQIEYDSGAGNGRSIG